MPGFFPRWLLREGGRGDRTLAPLIVFMRNMVFVRTERGANPPVYGPAYEKVVSHQLAKCGMPPRKIVFLVDDPEDPLAKEFRKDGSERRKLRDGCPGWWAKMEIFAPWNEDLRPLLFCDLDTYFIGNITCILNGFHEQEYVTLADFVRPGKYCTALIGIPRDTTRIWNFWLENRAAALAGKWRSEQEMLEENFPNWVRLQDCVPWIRSYKVSCQESPGDSRIVCFHGQPRPHEAPGWAQKEWDEALNSQEGK